jgi:hypothetical protein
VEYYQKACDGGEARGCVNLGKMYADGETVGQNPIKAVQLYEKGCNGGQAQGCHNLAVIYFDSNIYPKAVQFFKKACDMGMAGSCINLGYIYANGKGVCPASTTFSGQRQLFFPIDDNYKLCDSLMLR